MHSVATQGLSPSFGLKLFMDVRWILGGSVLLQVIAAILALRLIRITGRRAAWTLIATAIVLMAVRRSLSLYDLTITDETLPHEVTAELVAFGISALILAGVAFIAPTFRVYRQSELALREAQDTLEERVRARTNELASANKLLGQQIAERNLIEKALRASEDRFRTVSESISAAVFIYRGAKIIEVNPASCAMTGYSREELLGMDFWEVLHPDFQPLVKERGFARQAGKDNIPSSYEVKLQRKDGDDRWITFNGSLVEFQGQQAVVCTAYDISGLKRIENALREADAHQRLILQTVPMAIYTAEPAGHQFVVWMSGQAEQITGFPAERFLQRDGFWEKRIHPDDAERVMGVFANLAHTEATAFEYRWECADGEYRWFLEHPTFLRDAKGNPSEIIGTWLDINERKMAEEALYQSEHRIQAIINNTTAVIYLKDLDGKYLLINRRYAELFDLDYEDAVGKTDYDFHPAPIAEAFRENDRNVLERDKPIEFEELAPREDGDHTFLSLKFPVYDANGVQSGVCGISTDITERKRFEQDLRQAKEAAETANLAKSRFLANISHEIRTPITAMLGAAEQMQSTQLNEKTRMNRADMILRNDRHLLALVNDLLDVSRLEAGKLEIRTADCSLIEILSDVCAITPVAQLPDEIEFRVFFETDVPLTIHSDRTRITQAIANLVSNACKFTRKGHIHLRVGVARGDGEPRLKITVEDTGPGIAAEDRQRIFDVFSQGDLTVRASLTGAGVGLSLSRWIANQLGGSLELEQSDGGGSIFVLRIATGELPESSWIDRHDATRRLAGVSSDVSQDVPALRGRVLLAEDAADTRTLIHDALRSAGATVVVAVDGCEAVERYEEDDGFDLILLDIRMPKMDGFATGKAIREKGYRSALIALTASTTAAEKNKVFSAGFDEVWTKPMSLNQLIRNVSAFLDSEPSDQGSETNGNDRPILTQTVSPPPGWFLGLLPERVKAIQNAVNQGDRATFHELLHQLVGSAGLHGLPEISTEAATLIESLERCDDPPTLHDISRLVELASIACAANRAAKADRNDEATSST